jgi:hypothetical protein
MEKYYDVVFYGQIHDGKDFSQVKQLLVKIIGKSESELEHLFSGNKFSLKKCSSYDHAKKYADLFEKIGAKVAIEQIGTDRPIELKKVSPDRQALRDFTTKFIKKLRGLIKDEGEIEVKMRALAEEENRVKKHETPPENPYLRTSEKIEIIDHVITVKNQEESNSLNHNQETKLLKEKKSVWPIRAEPISNGTLYFIRSIGWAIAIIGVISGIKILVDAPEAPSDFDIRFYGDKLPVKIEQMVRLSYLSLGLGQIIGGIVTGTLLHVIAGIGDTVLDIWKAQQPK